MSSRLPAALAALLLLSAAPALAQDEVDAAAQAFVSDNGLEPQDLEPIEGALGDLLGADPEAMIPADADISPIEKALLLIETQETPLDRVRYVLRYNQKTIDTIMVSFIDVQRYNLGPAIREEAMDAYGAENTADAEAFGVGPHVEWRFVTQPTAKSSALLLAAGRMEIGEDDAAERSCFGRTCLSLELMDNLADWSEVAMDAPIAPIVSYDMTMENDFTGETIEELAPAYEAVQLAVAAGIAEPAEGSAPLWSIPERQGGDNDTPFIALVIDRNLGQEIMSDMALGISKLGKDSEERWVRLAGGWFDGTIYQSQWSVDGQLQAP